MTMEPSLTDWLMVDRHGDVDPLPDGPRWLSRAACVGHDPALWFPEGKGASTDEAIAICEQCPVRVECAEWAIAERFDVGIWAGLTPDALAAARRDDRAA